MIIKNGVVFTDEYVFAKADVAFEGGVITQIAPADTLHGADVMDAKGGYVLPGFVDIHTHGAVNFDFCDGNAEGIEKMLAYYGSQGVTTVVPATMSFNQPILADVLDVAIPYFEKEGHGAVLRGVNMEGPFINMDKKGAQNGKYIVNPQIEMFNALYQQCGGRIRLVDIAPELPGSLDFIKAVKDKCTISIAHTNANYDQALAAFEAGASHVTHLFNAMPPFTHRAPGVIGAASDMATFVELISDGFHLHPSVVRAVFNWFGKNRVCLISDCMRATGMPDGDDYSLGGQRVIMQGGKATLEDGTLAGSATNLAEMTRRAIGFGVPMEDALRAATANPATATGLIHQVGSLTAGKQADIVIWNQKLENQAVLVGGKLVAGQ
ncbi:N-acetylglucosamine-6-phosphate deacetylase [Ruminococcaceae bacterium OttesenSCG-928-A16]|nr:N-acetylglucosamine-6-phosphate deacetylase [Ruminococcaceae bacterium OttesenSCG-928-A16]